MDARAKEYWNGKGVNGYYLEEKLDILPKDLLDKVLSGLAPYDGHGVPLLSSEPDYELRNTEILLYLMRCKHENETVTYFDDFGFSVDVDDRRTLAHAKQAHEYAKHFHSLYRSQCIEWCRDKVYYSWILKTRRNELDGYIDTVKVHLQRITKKDYEAHIKRLYSCTGIINRLEIALTCSTLLEFKWLHEEEKNNFFSWLYYIGFLTDEDITYLPLGFFSHNYRAYSEIQPNPINYFISNQLIEYIENEADTLKLAFSNASPYKDIPPLVAANTQAGTPQPAPLPGEQESRSPLLTVQTWWSALQDYDTKPKRRKDDRTMRDMQQFFCTKYPKEAKESQIPEPLEGKREDNYSRAKKMVKETHIPKLQKSYPHLIGFPLNV